MSCTSGQMEASAVRFTLLPMPSRIFALAAALCVIVALTLVAVTSAMWWAPWAAGPVADSTLAWLGSHPSAAWAALNLVLVIIAIAGCCALIWPMRSFLRSMEMLARRLEARSDHLQPLAEDCFASGEMLVAVRAFNELLGQLQYQKQLQQRLLVGIGRDLRAPLTRLRWRIERCCDGDEAAIDESTADVLALERIVDQVMAYTDGDAKTSSGNARPLTTCVAETVADYEVAKQPVLAELQMVNLLVPEAVVQRLLVNLIDNALAYGRTPVTVALMEGRDGVQLQVWDGGAGLTPDEFKRATEPLLRAAGPGSEARHCGLGLVIAAQMARRLGGQLYVRHDLARGFGVILRLTATLDGV
jgi:two-component system, OmpR family, osmolarity sensor histidine kinase EnvZ